MKRAEDSARIWSKIESQKTEKEAHDKLLESMKHEIRFETPAQLERLAAVIWEKMGFVIEQQAQGGPDEGIDVLAFKSAPFPQRVLIQCKLHDKPIGVSTVREYGALRNRSGIDDVVIIAPSGFTEPALKEADELKVKLIDKSVLNELIDEHFSGRKSSLEW